MSLYRVYYYLVQPYVLTYNSISVISSIASLSGHFVSLSILYVCLNIRSIKFGFYQLFM